MHDTATIAAQRGADDSWTLNLEGEISVFHSTSLLQAALAIAESGGAVRVLCDAVRSADLSAVQILLALERALRSQSRSLRVEAASPEMAETLKLAGLAQELGLADTARTAEPCTAS